MDKRKENESLSVKLGNEWMSKVDSQEHPAAAQTIDHPVVKDARPEYPSADERINVLSLSAINGGDRSDTSQGVDKVDRRFVHRLWETCKVGGQRRRSQIRAEEKRKKKKSRGKLRNGKENTYQSFQV